MAITNESKFDTVSELHAELATSGFFPHAGQGRWTNSGRQVWCEHRDAYGKWCARKFEAIRH